MTYRLGRDDWFRRLRQQGAGKPQKPLGGKAYGSIPHLPGSKFGNRRDRGVPEGEDRLYLERPHPGDWIVVQEKLDGSCVAILKKDDEIIPLIRNGYPAAGSVWRQHRLFARWVRVRADAFAACLDDGDRVVGEWLAQAHGTRYDLTGRQPFVVFDYFRGDRRLPALEAEARAQAHGLAFVPVLAAGPRGVPLPDALVMLGEHGHYGAIDPAEGVVYRRETPSGMVYLAKYVRPEAEPGRYLPGDGDPNKAVWNWPQGDGTARGAILLSPLDRALSVITRCDACPVPCPCRRCIGEEEARCGDICQGCRGSKFCGFMDRKKAPRGGHV